MGECKESVTMRVRRVLRVELVTFADRERRSLGNLGATLLEWAFEQLKVAGTVDRLLKVQLANKREKNG
jgi:hypothetical protein